MPLSVLGEMLARGSETGEKKKSYTCFGPVNKTDHMQQGVIVLA